MKTTLTIEESARLIELGVDAKMASKCESAMKVCASGRGIIRLPESRPIFTLSDLLSILPKEIIINGKTENLNIVMDNYGVLVGYPLFHKTHGAAFVKTELIDALNSLLVYVLKNFPYENNKN